MTGSSDPKVVLLTARSDTGGGPKHVFELTNFLIKNNIQPIICSPLENPYGPEYLKKALFHVQCPHRSFSLNTLFSLIKIGKENSSIIFHSHGRGAGFYTKVLSLFGFKCFHTFHGAHAPKSIKESLIFFIEKVMGKNIKKYICVSPDEKENALALKLSQNKNTTIVCNNYSVSHEMRNPKDSFSHLGILSRLDPHKNNQVALVYFSHLLKKRPELKLSIAGDGEEREELVRLSKELKIEGQVEFLGNVTDIDSFFEKVDCLISASKGEGLPYTILEAFERSVPCLLSNVHGHRFLQDKKLLFDLNSAESFESCFYSLEKIAQENVESRFKFLSTSFNEESTFGKLINLYQEEEK